MGRTKPVALKKGTITKEEYNKRAKAEEILKGETSIANKPPAYLCSNGKKIYKNIVDSLPKSFLNNTDEYVVSIVADSIAKMQEAQKLIERDGLLVEYTNSAGATNTDQNKAILIYQKYNDIFKKYIGEIGLSPQGRSRLAMISLKDEKEKQDPLLKVLGGQR